MEARIFADRREAGKALALALRAFKGKKVLVLALPRGGVGVGYEIALALECPLDTIVARKVGAPGNPEYAVGAIAPGGIRVVDTWMDVEDIVRDETREMERRIEKYKSGSYAGAIKPDVAIVVDDGVATGKTAEAALRSARASYPNAKIVFAAPVGASDSIRKLQPECDEIVVLEAPLDFGAVGEWYASFPQVSDEEVIGYLEKARRIA